MRAARSAHADRTRTALFAGGLFILNLYVCRELFWTGYLNQMGSIEAVYIGLARYIMNNGGDLTWFPLWYGGIPFQDSYPPFLPSIVALVASLFRWPPALAYHCTTAFLYCSAPVTLFLLCVALSGSRVYSFFAGLIYSVLSPSAFVVAEIRQEIGLLRPRRFQALVSWGEGPHVAGLALLPLAVLWLHRSVTRRRPIDFVVCAILFAAVALTNWLAAVALFAAVLAYVCSTNLRPCLVVVPIAVLAYGMAAPWIPPSTINTIRVDAPYLGNYGDVYSAMAPHLAIAGLLGVVVIVAIRRATDSLALRFSAIFAFSMAALVLPKFWWKVYIVPQPDRYQLEMELGLAMLAIFAIKPLLDRMPGRFRMAIAVLAILFAIIPAKSDRRFARYLIGPVKIDQTIRVQNGELDRPQRETTPGIRHRIDAVLVEHVYRHATTRRRI